MQKEELLHLHMLMIQVKKYYEHLNNTTIPTEEYDTLGITPLHIHKSKNVHCVALMTLGNEIVAKMRDSVPVLGTVEKKQSEIPVEH
ncbi:MAG TPA: UPF0058 family protein [Methanocorpusculum sp.]|nr:UPF0058 family protein [Methanocorpusculum sp.]